MAQPVIKVGIVTNREIIALKLTGKFLINDHYNAANEKISFILKDDKIVLVEETSEFIPFEEVYIKSLNLDNNKVEVENVTIGIDFHWEKHEEESFQGDFKIILKKGKMTLINIIPVEKYLESVISSEMNPESPVEYLKAHSIISRSWLLAQLEIAEKRKNHPESVKRPEKGSTIKWYDREDHDDFDVCADDHCQRYHGVTKITNNRSLKAVRETFGLCVTFNGQICDARYSKCCGGYSEEFGKVWQDEEFPYLTAIYDNYEKSFPELVTEEDSVSYILSRPEAYCNTTDKNLLEKVLVQFDQATKDFYRWEIQIKQLALSTLLRLKLGVDLGQIIKLIPLERGKSGRISQLKIVGSKNTLIIGKELEIRRALSEKHLYSSAFIVEYVYADNQEIPSIFVLKGAGWGHGVGFCQIGGAVMADKGKKHDEILKHYFTGSKLEKMY